MYEKWKQAHNLIEKCLGSLDPILAPLPVLDSLHKYVDSAVNEFNAFELDSNASHLEDADKQVDKAIITLSNLIIPTSLGETQGLSEAIQSFRTAASENIRKLEEEVSEVRIRIQRDFEKLKISSDQLSDQMAGLVPIIDSQKVRLDTAISQFQQQFSDAEGKRREEFSQGETNRNAANAEAVKRHDAEFKDSLEKKDNKFQDLESKYAAAMEEAKVALNKVGEQLQKDSKEVMDNLLTLKERAESLVHVIGNTGMVGGYQKVANIARIVGWGWHGITVLSMIGLIMFGYQAFTSTQGSEFSWGSFGGRVFAALTFGILAAYGARQADKQGEIERTNRKFELELASIDPYLVGLPVDEQHKVKIDLAQRLFGKEEAIIKKDSSKTSGTAMDIAKAAVEALKEQTKKG